MIEMWNDLNWMLIKGFQLMFYPNLTLIISKVSNN